MKNNQFLQWFLFGKQKRHRQTYFHLMVFSAFVIIFKINQIGCEDKSVRKKYEDDETYLERSSKDSQEDLSYDPWRESERPKLFVDYLNGPLKGKKLFNYSIKPFFNKVIRTMYQTYENIL